jgi:hypothetical protein
MYFRGAEDGVDYFKDEKESAYILLELQCALFTNGSQPTGGGNVVVVEEEGRGGTTIALLHCQHHKARATRRTYLFVRPAMMASSEVVILIGPLAQLSLSINSPLDSEPNIC